MPITYGSVCSGIEAATVAWHPLGWRAEWYAEIEPFPCAVLAHHYPATPNHGDMTRLAAMVLSGKIPAPEVLVGGTPCQAFSVAGMREGLADPRGALTIKYVELLDAIDHVRTRRGQPEAACLWENVPGVLSDKGNAFGCFLGALVGESEELQPPGGKWKDAGCVYGPTRTVAWRVLDAQYFGLAQRRRRVFVVASARAGFDPLEVLFEREGVRRDTPPRRGEGQDLAGRAPFGPALQCGCGWIFGLDLGQYGCPNCEGDEGPAVEVLAGVPAYGGHSLQGDVSQAATLTAKDTRLDMESETFCIAPTITGGARKSGGYSPDDIPMVAGTLQANGKAAGSATQQDAENGMLVVHGTQDPDVLHNLVHPLGRNSGQENALLAFSCKDHGADAGDLAPTLRAMNHSASHPNAGGQVAVCITGEITHTLKAEGFDASEDGTGRGQPIVAHAIQAGALRENPASGPDGVGVQADHAYTLEARAEVQAIQTNAQVRRLTPRECEWLQGFPGDHTRIPYRGKPADECPDGPRYKAIGNSKAVFVVRWIGRRIQQQLERLA
ncbi:MULTISPECIES: DNA cytosine methyltransferase [Pseudomonas]|uniref:DNA (cytosine-5-)-methyltransferase n=1 Tax=Pseudomonas putida (strain ATCC 47054 / DSM 6125 / CFBP 8728 / NCIMB 11950 / KT2440) TaxID=160488 RepID=Q88G14_PSEPK|nr:MULTISPECIES: DNA cytosine methyltransferase [Pseudomonas]AAN69506.1 DNA-cytosine methyltransferase [Pseudomonas putida KT2440]KMU94678.1 cytosine methyltransferase [Pseudomonas putida]KMY31148.1 cytosine methyltransferase [Pseudomonas putida]MDD2082000.1 DNA cytosine methyltransferase [Pseudomonas putida]PXZ46781.1 DNA cytosine methyltransferase [Pseudomonas sp. SMT-1]